MSEKQVKDYDKFVLRLPEGMRDAIAERAKRNGRSMNAEIVQILEDTLYCGDGDLDDRNANELLRIIKAQEVRLVKQEKILEAINEHLTQNRKPA